MRAVSIRSPARNVLSWTLPLRTFLSLVRTKAPPLPGLTWRNSMTCQRSPFQLRTRPLRMSAVVVAMRARGGVRLGIAVKYTPGASARRRPPGAVHRRSTRLRGLLRLRQRRRALAGRLGRTFGGERERDPEPAPDAGRALDLDPPAVPLDHLLAQHEAEAAPPLAGGARPRARLLHAEQPRHLARAHRS